MRRLCVAALLLILSLASPVAAQTPYTLVWVHR